MSESKQIITNERIEQFLQGSDPQKYIVAVEAEYNEPRVTLVINDPNTGKKLENHKYQPFLWFKDDVTEIMYGGKRMKIMEACQKFDVKITKLRTSNDEGYTPARMESGYKYIAKCKGSYNSLINFFKEGGVDVFKGHSKLFVLFNPIEQFLIQTGKRLFKGMDDYDDVHRFQFDLETEGLFASKHGIFQIGFRNNRGIEHVLEVTGNTPQEKRDSERENIAKFFKVIDAIQPDIIAGYNSENFDWPYLFERAERLGMDIRDLVVTLNRIHKIKRKPATLKLGGETEAYNQTHMYGYNIIDISHAVRRAMAINSEIKSWGLKYITQYSDIAKPNRVYVQGDKINSTWVDKINKYAFNDTNGDWYKIGDKTPLKENYKIVTGKYIVERYLCDDLWETEQIDNLYNQASFLISKMLPTTFMRSSTMGTAGQWKLIMSAWSYENGLAIPETQSKRDFTGGLSRLLQVGYAKNVVKLDFAALYPKTQLTWSIFPDLDISGVMRGILTYVVDTRDHFKFLTGIEKGKLKKLQKKLDENKANMTSEEITSLKAEISEHKRLSTLYDKKQLPLKILANSWFGSYGAPYIFNWGDTDSAEETTCRGRQSLRLMVRHFTEKHGFKPLVGDTDGFNFAFPDNIDDIKYVAKGSHWKTKDDAGKELIGLDAVLAEFNENYMEGRMGLDIDDVCNATINFARKNYANDIDGKIKLVGNSVKSKKMSVFIEEFLSKAIRMLLDGDGYSFINYYYQYVDKIYNYQIPLVKMATKAKVKSTMAEYRKKATMKNKAGNPMPKQAHMELALREGMDVTLGDVLYYINTGNSKTQGDLKTINRSKLSKKQLEKYIAEHGGPPMSEITVQLNCKLINPEIVDRDFELIKEVEMLTKALAQLEEDPESQESIQNRIDEINSLLFTDEYNVVKYLESFNKKVKPLLVCFQPEIRDRVLLNIVKHKDKTTKIITEKLQNRLVFTKGECELISGIPFKQADQDSYEELMTMEDKEIKFWDKVNKVPNYMSVEEWESIRKDYHERMAIAKAEGIENEKNTLENIFKKLEVGDLNKVITKGVLPIEVFSICDLLGDGSGNLVSRKWGEQLCHVDDIFKHEKEAVERNKFYKLTGCENDEQRYELWLDYIIEQKFLSGETETIKVDEIDVDKENIVEKITEYSKEVKVTVEPANILQKSDDDDESEDEEESETDEYDDGFKLDDEFDDTFADTPDDYVFEQPKEVEEDEWPF
jgi:DNA polymerase elongation subunit (family B)